VPSPTSPTERDDRTVAAFDFDGTLIRGDSLLPFLGLVAGRVRVGRALAARAHRIVGALAGLNDRDLVKADVLGSLLAGVDAGLLSELGRAYAQRLLGRLRPDVWARVAWHRERGHELVIVSASLAVYLDPLGSACGFDQVLATELEIGDDGRATGRLLGVNVRGPEKLARLSRWLGGAPSMLYAYGDSAGDRFLLAAATEALMVRRRGLVGWTETRSRRGKGRTKLPAGWPTGAG
jgi:HAD superfamily hydrolase (TIGR01490 family)